MLKPYTKEKRPDTSQTEWTGRSEKKEERKMLTLERLFDRGMMDHFGSGNDVMSWISFGLRTLFILALIALAIVLIVRAARHHRHGPMDRPEAPPSPSAESALKILNERYARGEIEEEAYRKMKEELRRP
jgi:uncharacterized membrane protein